MSPNSIAAAMLWSALPYTGPNGHDLALSLISRLGDGAPCELSMDGNGGAIIQIIEFAAVSPTSSAVYGPRFYLRWDESRAHWIQDGYSAVTP